MLGVSFTIISAHEVLTMSTNNKDKNLEVVFHDNQQYIIIYASTFSALHIIICTNIHDDLVNIYCIVAICIRIPDSFYAQIL